MVENEVDFVNAKILQSGFEYMYNDDDDYYYYCCCFYCYYAVGSYTYSICSKYKSDIKHANT